MRKKSILAVLLSSAIVFSGMPGNVFAAEEFTQEEEFFGGEDVTEDIAEEPTEDVGESVLESDQGAEEFAGFSDGEGEDFVDEEEIEDETDPETQVYADAEGVVESGKCGDDLTYTITGDETNGYTLTISGTGDMYDYNSETTPWNEWKKKIIKLEIGTGVTSIGAYAFFECLNIKGKLIIPNGVRVINNSAFEGCWRFDGELVLPDTVINIEDKAFYNCQGFDGTLHIPESVEKIGNKTFDYCFGIKAIYIPKTIKEIGNADYKWEDFKIIYGYKGSEADRHAKKSNGYFIAVDDDSASTNEIRCGDNISCRLTYDENRNGVVLTIEGNGSLSDLSKIDYSNINYIELSDEITNIGNSTFSFYVELNGNLVLPKALVSIGDYAFNSCSGLSGELIFPDTIKTIGKGAFKTCASFSGKLDIPSSIEVINEETFKDCWGITSVVLHDGTIKIDNSAFSGCKSLESITIPASVVKIKDTAFDGCPNLTIYGVAGSYAEHFAKENLVPFKATSKANIASATIQNLQKQYYYTGSEIKPEITVMFGNTKAELDKDYTVSYANNVKLGTATVTITGAGNYEGGKSINFEIVEKEHKWDDWQEIKAATYKETGIRQRKCVICGAIEKQEIAKLVCTNHSWSNWTTVKNASVSEEGEQQRTCVKCGNIESKKLSKLSLIPKTLTLKKGKTSTLKPASSWKNVKYSTSNKKVATVDKKGKVKAVSVGTAKITVKSGSKKAICIVTVPGTTAIKGIKSTISVKRGKTYTLKPKLSYAGKADRVTYKSSNKKIATVSKKGVIKGKKKGTATITIKSGKVTKKCKVKVK